MRLLVTEDDPALAAFLRKGLAIEGYEVDLAVNGEGCLQRLDSGRYDLLLLDLTLPDVDGAEVLRRMQGLERNVPTLVLTGRTQVEERIRCLDLGADDFLVKPFSFGELTARCRAALRRYTLKADGALRLGGLTLNRLDRSVSCAGVPVDLTPKEFALLEALLLRGGECCSREELLEQVWNKSANGNANVVDVYINYLRRKLSSAAAGAESGFSCGATPLIQTMRGSGYRLAPPLKRVEFSLPVQPQRGGV